MATGEANPHQLAVAVPASRAASARNPASRRGSAATRRELRCPRWFPPPAVSPAPAPRVHPLAHVHRLRRRSGRAAARGRGAVRALAARSHARMNPVQKSVALKRRGEALGFDAVGVASLERNAHADELDRWLAAGYAGAMSYLHRQAEQRKLPHRIMPEATVAVVTLTSYFHGSADAALAPDAPFEADRCGTCTRCLEACPTAAFPDPRVLDARRCISYLTIEHRGAFTDTEQRMVGDWLFGCDVCQDVCPWNVRFATPTTDPELAPRPELSAPELDTLLRIDPEEFDRRFGDTAFERAGPDGMRRNAAAASANRR